MAPAVLDKALGGWRVWVRGEVVFTTGTIYLTPVAI